MAGLLVTTQEGGNYNLALADGGQLLVQNVPGSAGGVSSVTASAPLTSSGGLTPNLALEAGATVAVSVATSAALTAFATTGLAAGTLAYVASRTTYWSYQPTDPGPADGNHIAAAGGGFWVYVAAGNPFKAANTLAWFVDAVSGNDDNAGTTAPTALKTKWELARRWGSWSPNLTGAVVITYLSNDSGGTDPGLFAPNLVNGATLQHVGTQTQTFTGTLLAVTAKNLAAVPAVFLSSTFTTTTGAIAVGQVLTNTTRGNSTAIVSRSLGAGAFLIQQPLAAWSPGTFPAVNVDTWAAGDAIVGRTNPTLDFAEFSGFEVTINGLFANPHTAQNINFVDTNANAAGGLFVDCRCCPLFVNCNFSRPLSVSLAATSISAQFWGCDSSGGGSFDGPASGICLWSGGGLRGITFARGLNMSNTPLINSTCALNNTVSTGVVFLDVSGVVNLRGYNSGGFAGATGSTLNVQEGSFNYASTAAVAANVPTLKLNGIATGYSNLTSAGLTATHQLALSAANLDAAAGATGFGGYAFGGGAAFCKSGVQP